jgi:hypothetical protein
MNFLETAIIVNAQNNIISLYYLDSELEKDLDSNIGLQSITFKHKQKVVNLETFKISAKINNSISNDLYQLHGLNAEDMTKDLLENEYTLKKNKKLYEKYYELSEKSRINELTKWQMFIKKIIPSVEFVKYFKKDSKEGSESLCKQILLNSRKIAANSRMGEANFLVCSPSLSPYITESSLFTFDKMSEHSGPNNYSIYTIGKISDIRVFINPYLSINDNNIILGRFTKENENGVFLVEKRGGHQTVIPDLESNTIIKLELMKIAETDSAYKSFYNLKASFDKKPFWKKILFI